ncbi:N-acetylmuramic acid-6-phosphate etherase [Caloranaerobacter azorensis H53214]|uniref:N-acetylmuramic acid 6-phosphate etherase n=1 Tax=Caloranaerobacter azorensis H53214 TaxID=1156417 RepID=A0A096BFE8_9FIRM|nr:N-acetylmuramic acid 6-phosphate etherase [Caloranaerobacter azorensis]KGG79552.1 N-acetylmuramic acid-6-phosphate etherase [Caloranaerobacter azorensis H53214]
MSDIIVEGRNVNTLNIDKLSTLEIIEKINDEDKKVAYAVEKEKNNIAKAVDLIVESFNKGGRLFYVGSGTSGKLGVLDASECPPTFGVDDSMVQGIISGGEKALSGWLEYTEDDEKLAIEDMEKRKVNFKDVVVGISASGNTPYVIKAIEYAKKVGAKTVGLICNSKGKLREICDITICVEVGPEVIMGSTRMKAGTAQKMVLNMLSTASMIKIGKVYSNLMVNVRPINKKLRKRVEEIVYLATGAEEKVIKDVLEKCDYNAKLAIIMIKKKVNLTEAKNLDNHGGN